MKKRISLVTAAFVFGLVSTSIAAEGMYVSGNFGSTSPTTTTSNYSGSGVDLELEFNTGYSGGGAVGYDFGKIRLEGEIAYQKTDLSEVNYTFGGNSGTLNVDGDFSTISALINGYFDIKNDSAFTPFISGGLGYADNSMNNVSIDGQSMEDISESGFAYHLGFGCSFAVNEKLSLGLKYRYFVPDEDFKSHNILFIVRMNFE